MRVVSLLPSATEIVYALGRDEHLVGVTFECDEPARARLEKAVVVGGRGTSSLSPREIDDYVRGEAAAGRGLYVLHADALARLAPDVILTQDLCRVCALPSGRVEQALDYLDYLDYLGCRADVVTLDPHTLPDVLETIELVGQRIDAAGAARTLVAGLQQRLAGVARRVADPPPPRVAVVEWVDPPFTAGHWVPDLVTAAGGTPVGAQPGARSTSTTWAALRDADPEVVLVAPRGFGVDGAAEQARAVAAEVPDRPVWALDANALIVRPGPRLVDGVEAIAAILHGPGPQATAAVRVA